MVPHQVLLDLLLLRQQLAEHLLYAGVHRLAEGILHCPTPLLLNALQTLQLPCQYLQTPVIVFYGEERGVIIRGCL